MMPPRASARPMNGINAPYPLINLDRISKIVADTYDHIAEIYAAHHLDDTILRDPLEVFVRLLKKHDNHDILDIGCGPGSEVNFLTSRGFNVTGIDASTEMVQKAHQRFPFGRFGHMKMHDLQYREASFDAIWSARTLTYVPKALVVDLLVSWKRILKPDGILGVSVIIGERNGWEQAEYAPGWLLFNRYFAEGEIEEALKEAGFSILESPILEDERNPARPHNCFIFAQKPGTHLDLASYHNYVHYSGEKQEWIVSDEHLERVIAYHLQAGTLSAKESVNLCVLYDQLATRERANEEQYKVTAWKLKLHLHTTRTLSSQDFEVWFTLGKLHLKLKQFEQAVSCFDRALQLRPKHFAALVRLSYSYEGLGRFDEAIGVALEALQLTEKQAISPEEQADLYHALGHFYISRSLRGNSETSGSDSEKGDHYMQLACTTEARGHAYVSCLSSIYNETERFSDTIRVTDNAIGDQRVRENVELYNQLLFCRGEAYLGTDRYDEAMENFKQVEEYASYKKDWDALAHAILYQVRTSLERKHVSELDLGEIHSCLELLYEHEPSPYVTESFQREREQLISILSAFYLLKQCLEDTQEDGFGQRLEDAVAYMKKVYDEEESPGLRLLVLADEPSAVEIDKFGCPTRLVSFEEVETDLTEREMEEYPVWGVLAFQENIEKKIHVSTLAHITFLIGEFYQGGYIIYVYDPKKVFPESMRKSLQDFFVDRIEDLERLCYMISLYDRSREYLGILRPALCLTPIGIAPSLVTAQTQNVGLLPLEECITNE